MLTNHALGTPSKMTPSATPAMRASVLPTYPGNTVAARCDQVCIPGAIARTITARIGAPTNAATAMALTLSAPPLPAAEVSIPVVVWNAIDSYSLSIIIAL